MVSEVSPPACRLKLWPLPRCVTGGVVVPVSASFFIVGFFPVANHLTPLPTPGAFFSFVPATTFYDTSTTVLFLATPLVRSAIVVVLVYAVCWAGRSLFSG